MKGRGDYILYMDRRNFTNSGMREPCHGTDHRMVRTVLRGEGALHNRRYGWVQARWPIQPNAERSQNKGGADFEELKGEVTKTLWPTKSRAYGIPQETWQLSDRRAALQRSHGEIIREVRQAPRKFQRYLQGERQRWVI